MKDHVGYIQRREGDTLYIDSFGTQTNVTLVKYLSDFPEITKLIVTCPVPEAMRFGGIDLTRSKIKDVIFEQGRNNLPVGRAPDHKIVITDKKVENLSGKKRSADEQLQPPRTTPSVATVQASATSSVSQSSYPMPTFGQPPKPVPQYSQRSTPAVAVVKTSSTSSASQFIISKPLERPAMTNQPPKPTFATQKPVARPANSQPPRPILSTPAPKAPAKPIANQPVQKPVSDTRYASTLDVNKPQSSSSSSSSNQLHRALSQQDLKILAEMGYSKEEFEELVKKEYDLNKVPALLRPVLAQLLMERANGYNKARLHQIVGLSEYIDALANNKSNALFEYATGSGKTFMFTQLASAFRRAYPTKSITIIVPTKILRDQTLEAFKKFANLSVNVIRNGKELDRAQNSNTAQVKIITYQLAMTGEKKDKAQRLLANSSAVIMDEAHYALPYMNNNPELKQIINNVPTLAFTATPEFNLSSAARGGLNDVHKLVGYDRLNGDNPISKFNVVPAILAKANCPVKCLVVFPESVAGLADKQISDNRANTEVSNVINTPQNNRMVADLLLNGKDDGEAFRYQKAIGFCSGTEHADAIVALINHIPNIVSIVDPNGLMRMNYALNLFKEKMSADEHQIDEIQELVSGILACEAGKSNDDLMQLEINNFIQAAKGRQQNITIVSDAISECIAEAYEKFEVASAVHSNNNKNDQENQEELKKYKLGGTRFLFGDQMLIAGFDDPATSVILNINPTASEPAAVQRAGRGLRLDPNNPNKVCKIIDFDWGMKQQRLFYEYLGNDENGNPNMQLGDMPAMPAPMEVEPVIIENKTGYSVIREYQGGQIEISHKTLRKKQRQQEEVEKVKQSKLGVVLEASVTKFNETLKILELLKQKLAQKLNRGESVVVDNDSSATLLKKRSASEEDDSSENRKVKRPKTERQPRPVVMQGRYTREMSKQINENVQKAQEMILTINEFFEALDLNPSSNAAPANTSRSSTNSTNGKDGTSIYEINMDSELQKFTTAASNLTGMVKKLQSMMKLNTLTVGSSAVASTSMQPAGIDEQNQEEARGALISLIENMNSIQNSSILDDANIDNLIAHSKQKKQESEEQKKQEELRKNQVEDNSMAEDAPQEATQTSALQLESINKPLFDNPISDKLKDDELDKKEKDGMNQSLSDKVTPPIFTAVKNKNIEEIKRLIANGADVDQAKGHSKHTPLRQAIFYGHTEVVEALLENGANVNLADLYGTTPLYFAVSRDLTEIVKILIQHGANVNAKRHKGGTALDVAKNEEIKKLLLAEMDRKSAEKNETSQVDNNDNNKVESVRSTNFENDPITFQSKNIRNYINNWGKNTVDICGFTPLIYLSGLNSLVGYEHIVKLITIGANLDAVHKATKKTALNTAVKNSYDIEKGGKIAIKLIDAGANLLIPDSSGMTPLHHLCVNAINDLVVSKILKKDARALYSVDNNRRTPLHCAVGYFTKNHLEIVKLLLDADKENLLVNMRDINGKTALDLVEDVLKVGSALFVINRQICQEMAEILRQKMQSQSMNSAIASTSDVPRQQPQQQSSVPLDRSQWALNDLGSSFGQELFDQFNSFKASTAMSNVMNHDIEPIVFDEVELNQALFLSCSDVFAERDNPRDDNDRMF